MFPMSLIVQKFGGTSVANTESLQIVAQRIIECKNLYVERVIVKDFLNSKFFYKIHFKKSNVHNSY